MGKHKLHHIGIIVPSIERVEELLSLLGLERGETQFVPEYEAECIFTSGPGASLEFIVPKGGKLAEFNRGIGGLHHIAIEVDDLEQFTEQLGQENIKLIESEPVDAGNILINFLLPIYTRGFTVEFVQTKR